MNLRCYNHLNNDRVYDPEIKTENVTVRIPIAAMTDALFRSNYGVNRLLICMADRIRRGEGPLYDPTRVTVADALEEVVRRLEYLRGTPPGRAQKNTPPGLFSERCVLLPRCDGTNSGWDLPDVYRRTFEDPKWNPRWEFGTAEFVEVVHLDAKAGA